MEELEKLLIGLFGVDSEKARSIKLTEEEFYERFQRLESLIGEENAPGVVKNGRFLDYRGQDLVEYFDLAHRARVIMTQVVPAPVFYSIESLKRFLECGEEKQVEIDVSRLNLFNYRLLQPDNRRGREFLEALCNDGYVTVTGNDYWSNGERPKGVRGGHIILAIKHQLTQIFNDLGINGLEYELSRGEKRPTITISDKTRELLREIRDKVYNQQE